MRHSLTSVVLLTAMALPAFADPAQLPDGLYAEIVTDRGTIICQLEFEKAPMTVSNFVGLAEGTIAANGVTGKRFYDGLTFHRVEKGFCIQGGDPQGNGSGGPGYEFPNEVRSDLKHDAAGVMAMANAGPNTNGSQFYVTLGAASWLDGGYSVFGHVVQGQDVANAIQIGDHMKSVRILRNGAKAGAFTVTQKGFDALVARAKAGLEDGRKGAKAAALADIRKKWPKLATTKSGLMYEVLKKGTGKDSPAASATVSIRYKGMLVNGKVFADTTADDAETVEIGRMAIKGWAEALVTMKRGETRRLVIPPELAFGSGGYGNLIPGDAFVVFDLELVDF
jgi:cyclophilin family peptidyl-prolyl cis-trans isomerase